ncbi:MAG: hypothetical protein KatS3mg131_1112 [Candidatus Tectimicrobiota bacterium]|nr:MAG: hypothetical protein KatS3mg131_1112 [Candidatus Tectomicrobia bacterium]
MARDRRVPLEADYALLGLPPGAPWVEVRRAYRRLLQQWHPDRWATDAKRQRQALEVCQRLNAAYARLRAGAPGAPRRPGARQGPVPLWLLVLGLFLGLRLGLAPLFPTYALVAPAPAVAPEAAPSPAAPLAPPSTQGEPEPAPPAFFTLGSSKAEVLAVQGTPTRLSETLWEYRGSRVSFRHGRVVGWEVWPRSPLRVRLSLPSLPVPAPAFFTLGSSKAEVLAVQGTPTRLSENLWEYGLSRVYFVHDRVVRWEAWRGFPLRARWPQASWPAPP